MSIPTVPCTSETHSSLHVAAHRVILNHYRDSDDPSPPDEFDVFEPFGLTTMQRAVVGLAGAMMVHLESGNNEDFTGLIDPPNLCKAGTRHVTDYVFWHGRKTEDRQERFDSLCGETRRLVREKWVQIQRLAKNISETSKAHEASSRSS
jgi:hypothetical protein